MNSKLRKIKIELQHIFTSQVRRKKKNRRVKCSAPVHSFLLNKLFVIHVHVIIYT